MDMNARPAPAGGRHQTRHGVAALLATARVVRLGALDPASRLALQSARGAIDADLAVRAVVLNGASHRTGFDGPEARNGIGYSGGVAMPKADALVATGDPAAQPERSAQSGDAPQRRADIWAAASRQRARTLRVAIRRAIQRLTRLMRVWRRRLAESDELRAMPDRELRDMSVSRYDVAHALRRPFWRS